MDVYQIFGKGNPASEVYSDTMQSIARPFLLTIAICSTFQVQDEGIPGVWERVYYGLQGSDTVQSASPAPNETTAIRHRCDRHGGEHLCLLRKVAVITAYWRAQ